MLPSFRSVLAVTDLSATGNLPIPHAYALANEGGTVHLLHVVDPELLPSPLYAHYEPGRTPTEEERARQVAALEERLRALVPPEAAERRVTTVTVIHESGVVSDAIVEEAEQRDVDAICIGTHGRTGLVKAFLGSVAENVVRKSRRPILIVRNPPPA